MSMVDLYPAYKPFRNFMSGFAAWPSLIALWGYYIHVVDKQPLRRELAVGKPLQYSIDRRVYPWDIEILVREAILHGGNNGRRHLSQWKDFSEAINHVRRLEDKPYSDPSSAPDVMLDLQRMAHRQFRWQSGRIDGSTIIRLMKIFGEETLNSHLLAKMGLQIGQLIRLGMALAGGLRSRPGVITDHDYSSVGIEREASTSLLRRLTSNLPELRDKIRAAQRYDETWIYTWSALEAMPLIRSPNGPETHAICPIPQYVLARLTTGVFYDIVNSPGFSNPYGDAFQAYVGEVIRTTVSGGEFQMQEEEPYSDGKANLKHGNDWIVSDHSGHLFVECKTKRMSVGSKTVTDPEVLKADLTAMAKAVAQNYKNVIDAQKGLAKWVPDELPIYPLVVTLEDWYLQSPRLIDPLNEQIREILLKASIDPELLDTMPYHIVSVAELEYTMQVVALRGIQYLLGRKVNAPFKSWSMLTYLQQEFGDDLAQVRTLLFPVEAQRLFPEFDTNLV